MKISLLTSLPFPAFLTALVIDAKPSRRAVKRLDLRAEIISLFPDSSFALFFLSNSRARVTARYSATIAYTATLLKTNHSMLQTFQVKNIVHWGHLIFRN